jgi:hypothetical protein
MSNIEEIDNTIQKRLEALIEALKMKPFRFSKALGYERPEKVYKLVKGKFNPGYETLVDILRRFPQVSPAWLMLGEGEMFRTHKPELSAQEPPVAERPGLGAEEKIRLLESQLADKEKIIWLLEQNIKNRFAEKG